MPATAEQKREKRRQEREAALAGDVDAQQRRAAERERIDKRFSKRTAAEQQERMKKRRKHVRRNAHTGDARANELLDREASRGVSRRNVSRAATASSAAVDTNGTAEFISLFASEVDASHIRKYLAAHPDSMPGCGWFSLITPEYLQKVNDPRQSALKRLYAIAFYRAGVAAIFGSCLAVVRAYGPNAGRVALAQRLLSWDAAAPWAPDDVNMATNHRTGVIEIPQRVAAFWTDELRLGLWAEAWDKHKGAFAADMLRLGHEPASCYAAALIEIQRRVDELTLQRDASRGPPPAGGFGHQWWELRYDGCQLGGNAHFLLSDRGLPAASQTSAVDACLDSLYAQAPYARMCIWMVHEAMVGASPFALGIGGDIPPTRASLGLTPWSASVVGPPVAPAYRAASIVHDQGSDQGSSSDARDRACRIFVQNLSWGTDDPELMAHLDTVIPGGVISASVLRHPDGRSRGIAKVMVQAPIDAETVIKELNGEALHGRALEIAHDRL